MHIFVKQSLRVFSATTLAITVACGGDKPAQDPSAVNGTESAPPTASSATTMPETKFESNVATSAPAEAPVPAKAGDKELTDAEIMMVTSTANTGEIEMARLATKNATSADVRSFASMMIAQHTEMETKGRTLATKVKLAPVESDMSATLKSNVSNIMGDLKTQKGKEFDKAYIGAQVKAHRVVLDTIDNKLLPSAQNGELKAQLNDARTHVAMHLAKAEEIQQKLESGSAVAPTTKPKK